MAGSYGHVVDDDGRLLNNSDFVDVTENLGDAYEMAEEMYGMIWWLATGGGSRPLSVAREQVELARQNYQRGLEQSPEVGREP